MENLKKYIYSYMRIYINYNEYISIVNANPYCKSIVKRNKKHYFLHLIIFSFNLS